LWIHSLLRRLCGGFRPAGGQCPSVGNGADGCFSITGERKDDFDFDPAGFPWSIMENPISFFPRHPPNRPDPVGI
jgi:hypothetical protein